MLDSGDLVTAVGIILSAGLAIWSLIRTGGLQEKQNVLASEQNQLAAEQNQLLQEHNDLIRRQGEGELPPGSTLPRAIEPDDDSTPAAGKPPRARFGVDLRPGGRGAGRLVIRNVGTQRAAAIQLEMEPDRDLRARPGERTFPALAPGEIWRIPFSRTMGSPSRYQWKLTWVEEPEGRRGEQSGWLSPP